MNRFLEMLKYRTFVLGAAHVYALTRYATVLFNRSLARRAAVEVQRNNQLEGFQELTSDEEKLPLLLLALEERLLANNLAQAAFSTRKCYAALRSDTLNAALQSRFGSCRLGREGFVTKHIDYKQRAFDILANPN